MSCCFPFSSAEFRDAVSRYKYGHRCILKFKPAQREGELTRQVMPHARRKHNTHAVLVALHVASSPADQLAAAVSIELLDYITSSKGLAVSSSLFIQPTTSSIPSILQLSPVLTKFSYNSHEVKGGVVFKTLESQTCCYSLLAMQAQSWLAL